MHMESPDFRDFIDQHRRAIAAVAVAMAFAAGVADGVRVNQEIAHQQAISRAVGVGLPIGPDGSVPLQDPGTTGLSRPASSR